MKIQITLFDKNKVYKPLSTVLDVKDMQEFKANQKTYINKAYQTIANKKYMVGTELIDCGYSLVKFREYNPEQIKADNMAKFALRKWKEKKEKENK